jgi:hypothetical protein
MPVRLCCDMPFLWCWKKYVYWSVLVCFWSEFVAKVVTFLVFAGLGWITTQYILQLSSWIFETGLALFNVLAVIFVARARYLSKLQVPRLIKHAAKIAAK